ncbi:Wzz/FepE/Etk N-terminal domain-containing protein [Gammaproteobacteria bacterium]|nr:Wzz/FepE/Etk N-terminal domain-containing protein [Gammaproteobacteria bacterium]
MTKFKENNGLESYIDITAIIKDLLSAKIQILFATIFIGVSAVLYSLSLTDEYKSHMILKPVENNSQPYSNQLNSLSAFAGFMPNQLMIDKESFALEILETRDFFDYLIEDKTFLVELLAINGFDKNKKVSEYNKEIYDIETEALREVYLSSLSLEKAHKKFVQHITVAKTKRGFIKISVTHFSPIIAKKWLDLIFNEINITVENTKTLEAKKSLDYLNKELPLTKETELKKVIAKLIENQIKTLMISDISDDFVFTMVDSPKVPEKKYAPNRAKICITITLIGFILICVIKILFTHIFLKKRYLA